MPSYVGQTRSALEEPLIPITGSARTASGYRVYSPTGNATITVTVYLYFRDTQFIWRQISLEAGREFSESWRDGFVMDETMEFRVALSAAPTTQFTLYSSWR